MVNETLAGLQSAQPVVRSSVGGLKPGQPAPVSGLYAMSGPRGGHGPEVAAVRGEPLPPTMPVVSMGVPFVDVADRDTLDQAMADQ